MRVKKPSTSKKVERKDGQLKTGSTRSTRKRVAAVLYQVPTVPAKKRNVEKKKKVKKTAKVEKKAKGKKGKKAAPKAKLSKVKKTISKDKKKTSKKGNDRLVPRTGISQLQENPFFHDRSSPEFVSVNTYHRWLIRALYQKDKKELKEVMTGPRFLNLHLTRQFSYLDGRTAETQAILSGDMGLTEEYYKLKRKTENNNNKHVAGEPNLLERKRTGHSNFYMIGRYTRPVEMTRGGREGNNALLNYESSGGHNDCDNALIVEMMKQGTSYSAAMKLFKNKNIPELNCMRLGSHLVSATRLGLRELAGHIAEGDAKYETNDLHRVTLKNSKLPDRILPASVLKKAFSNRNITPLHTAAINPDSKYLEKLRGIDPNINVPDQDNWFTVHYAAVCEGSGPLEFLLKNGASPTALNKSHESPLHVAAVAGRSHNIKILLDTIAKLEKPSDPSEVAKPERSLVNARTRKGDTPLLLAVKNNRLDAVKTLLDCSTVLPDHPSSTTTNKMTPLMVACSLGYLPMAELLISKGALVEAKDKKKRTAVVHAVLNGQQHTAAMLLAMGANIEKGDSSGNTAAHYASAYGWLDCLKLIASVDPECLNAENDWKITPLSVAYLKGHYGIVRWLLDGPYKANVNINGKDMDGVCLLSSLLRYSDEKTHHQLHLQIDFLLERGADCSVSDSLGNTILHDFAGLRIKIRKNTDKAVENGMTETEYQECFDDLLKGAGQQAVTAKNQEGLTPLHVALKSCNLKVFFWLVDALDDPKQFFSDEWSSCGSNIFVSLLSLPSLVWKTWKDQKSLPGKELYDVVPFIKNTLVKICDQLIPTWLDEKDKEGLEPILVAVREYSQLVAKYGGENEITPFVRYVSGMFETVCAIYPQCLLKCSSVTTNSNPNKPAPEISLFHTALRVNLETAANQKFHLLKTLLDCAARNGIVREVFSLQSEEKPLILSAIQADAAATRILLQKSAEYSCIQGVHDAVLSYVGKGDDRKRVNKTLLMLIIEAREFDLIPELQLTAKDWNAKDYAGNSVWHYAAQTNHHRTISLFKTLEQKKVPRTGNNLGKTPLHTVVEACDGSANAVLEPIEWLSSKGGIEMRDVYGRTAFHYAFATNEEFTQNNLAANCKDPIAVVSILAGYATAEVIDIADNYGNTALHVAAIKNANICAVSLIRKGASISLKNKNGNTPLALAVLHGRQSVALTLIQADSDVTAKVIPTQPEQKTQSEWVWEGAKKKAEPIPDSSVPAQIVNKGTSWAAMVYVLLDALGKNIGSLSQLTTCALRESQYNLANQLLKSLEAILDDEPLKTEEDLVLTFAQNFTGSLEPESVELTVLNRLLALGCKFKDDRHGTSKALEVAIGKGAWSLVEFFKTALGASWASLKPTDPAAGLSREFLVNQQGGLDPNGRKWIEELVKLKSLDLKSRALDLPVPVYLRGNVAGPFSPMGWVALAVHLSLMKGLREAGFDTNSPDEQGRTTVMLALAANNRTAFNALCSDDNPEREVEPKKSNGTAAHQGNNPFQNWGLTNKGRPPKGAVRPARPAVRSRRANTGGTDSSTDSDYDRSEESEEESDDESDEQMSESDDGDNEGAETEGKKFKITNKQLNLRAVDKTGRNVLHYLVSPMAWENVDILNDLHKEQPALVRELLLKADKDGVNPILLASKNTQRVLRAAMLKIVGKGEADKYPITPSSLNAAQIADCPYDVAGDSAAFLERWSRERDAEKADKEQKPCKLSGYMDTGVLVVCPETMQKMTVLLNKTDLNYGKFGFHNFYRMELIKRRDANLWILFTNWGRIGSGDGEHQTTPFNTLEAGIKEFKSVWKSKTGNEWADLSEFEDKPKKYRLVQVDTTASSIAEVVLPEVDKKKETDPVRAFVKDISNPHKLKKYLSNISGRNSYSCPFGRITADSVKRAREVLDECAAVVKKLTELVQRNSFVEPERFLKLYNEANDLSSEYYAAIKCGGNEFSALERIDSENVLTKARTALNRMEEIEIATMILTAAARRTDVERISYISSALNTNMQLLDPKSDMAQNILQWIHNSHGDKPPKVQGILSIQSKVATEGFAPFANEEKQMYLLHGTRAVNMMSILRHGLLVDPVNTQRTGRLFGDGVYFADCFEKSSHYCEPSADGVKYMLVCQVAVGKMVVKETNYFDDCKYTNVDTLHVKAANRPTGAVTIDGVSMPLCPLICESPRHFGHFGVGAYSEYIVNNSQRILPKFVIMYKN